MKKWSWPGHAVGRWLPALAWIVASGAWADIHYVSKSGAHTTPFTNWTMAATDIQSAVDAATDGDTVLVTNGVYNAGGRAGFPAGGTLLTNRVVIHKPVTVASVNGPELTIIAGQKPRADTAVRCVYLTNGATIVGFTFSNGATRVVGFAPDDYGGGVYADGSSAVVSNCIVSGCVAFYGGGSCGGTIYNSRFENNEADGGGGALRSTLDHCAFFGNVSINGGAGFDVTMNQCTMQRNTARDQGGCVYLGTVNNSILCNNTSAWSSGYLQNGGAAFAATINNSLLINNRAGKYGGATINCSLYNCTVSSNSAGLEGGGVYDSTQYNCIVYFNSAPSGMNYTRGSSSFSCTLPLPGSGSGNISNDPQFVSNDGTNYQLRASSPCINRGTNSYVVGIVDLEGNPRIGNYIVDMGAYEYGWYGYGDQACIWDIAVTNRPRSNLIDIHYILLGDPDQPVEVRGGCLPCTAVSNALDYIQCQPLATFAEGSEVNYGANIAPTSSMTARHLVWDAGTDIGHSTQNVDIVLWANPSNTLPIPLHFVQIPAEGTNAALKISRFVGVPYTNTFNLALVWAKCKGWATNAGPDLYAVGGSVAGQIIFTGPDAPTEAGKLWLCEKLGGSIRLANTNDIRRAQEATTPGTVTQWDSYYWPGKKVNEYGIETGASNAWYFVKEE